MSYFVHNVPGRMRVKLPDIRRRPSLENDIRHALITLYGVDRISINTITGSIIVNYDPDIVDTEQVLNVLKSHRYMDPSKPVFFEKPVSQTATRAGTAIGKAILSWTVSRALDSSGLSFLTAFV